MHKTYNHRSKQDLVELRDEISNLPSPLKAAAVVYSVTSGIIILPMRYQLALSALKLLGSNKGHLAFYEILLKHPKFLNDLWNGTMDWMVSGKDEYDAMSAGGWNKAELDGFLDQLTKTGWAPPEIEETQTMTMPVMR